MLDTQLRTQCQKCCPTVGLAAGAAAAPTENQQCKYRDENLNERCPTDHVREDDEQDQVDPHPQDCDERKQQILLDVPRLDAANAACRFHEDIRQAVAYTVDYDMVELAEQVADKSCA